MLSIETFGGVRVRRNRERIDDRLPAKAIAMLVYLGTNSGRAKRTRLAGLLWSDQSEERARANLRVVLSRLRREVDGLIEADREEIQLVSPVDLDASELPDADADRTADLYCGEFLADFDLRGAELFEDWVLAQRADLRAVSLRRFKGAALEATKSHDWKRCERFANAILSVDPWDAEAHRWVMQSLAHLHGTSTARIHFERYTADLAKELGVAPDEATAGLAERLAAVPSSEPTVPVELPEHSRPPTWPTKLVGRDSELADLDGLALAGRPVSIVGPGGIGKSRLLAEFATRRRAAGETVAFVGFEGHAPTSDRDTPRAFAETVLVALGVPADSERGAAESLQRFLGSAKVTLCLDNLEQLDGIELALTNLVRACPELVVVLTSRRRPYLVSGRVLEVEGLAHPATTESVTEGLTAAEELFLDRAEPARGDNDGSWLVGEICQALDGHPLAIELAAHWTNTASIPELAELLRSADPAASLRTAAPDLPARHRSLDVLVEASVEQVSPEARRVLRGASFFAGPFGRTDIDAVVNLQGDELAELVRHSLVKTDNGSYQLHPLIRRFARLQLDSADSPHELHRRHARQMVAIMNTMQDPLNSGRQFQRRAADLRAAIDWLVEHEEPHKLMAPLTNYLGFQRAWGWFESSHEIIRRTLERGDLPLVARAELHRHAGEAMLHAARYKDAIGELERGLELVGSPIPARPWARRRWNGTQCATLAIAPMRLASPRARRRAVERARLMSLLGELFYVSGQRAEMMSYGLGSLSAGRLSRDPVMASAGDAAVSIVGQLAGAHRLSERYRRRARQRAPKVTENPFTATETWGITALVAAGSGRWQDARDDTARAIAAGAASGRARMITQLEILLALLDYHEARYDNALARLQATQSSIERNGFRRALTWVHATRSETALRMGDCAMALDAADTALESAQQLGRSEDEARALAARMRAQLRLDRDVDLSALQPICVGLVAPSALAFQHFELHFGAVQIVTELEHIEPVSRSARRVATKQLSAYVNAFPAAKKRLSAPPSDTNHQ